MVVDTVIQIGRKNAAPLVPTRHVAKPADTRPRARVVNVPKEEMRHHEAVMEARHAAQSVRNDLQSAANALSAANAENDRLSKRVKDLEAENAKLRKGLENANRERQASSNALDELKKLSARVKDLEAENARMCKELEGKKQECSVLSEALDGLKSATTADGVPPPPPPPAQSEPVAADPALTAVAPADAIPIPSAPIKRKRNRGKKNKVEASVQPVDGVSQQ